MQGRRIADDEGRFKPGDYGRLAGTWYACTPSGDLGNLAAHDVTEHDDGTITVSPSILVREPGGPELWHGWLERGVWRSC